MSVRSELKDSQMYAGSEETKLRLRLDVEGLSEDEVVSIDKTTESVILAFGDPTAVTPRIVTYADPESIAALLGGIYNTIVHQYGPIDAVTIFNVAAQYLDDQAAAVMAAEVAKQFRANQGLTTGPAPEDDGSDPSFN